jgi:hypothetical protein
VLNPSSQPAPEIEGACGAELLGGTMVPSRSFVLHTLKLSMGGKSGAVSVAIFEP